MTIDSQSFNQELIQVLGLDGGEVKEDRFQKFLNTYFGAEKASSIKAKLSQDLDFFLEHDPASKSYTKFQVLSIRRGMAAIAAHRIFQAYLKEDKASLYQAELIAKYVQKDTNVEIHPLAQIASPFAMDHGHSTVIGATAIIGERVFMYHSVTLGASNAKSKSGHRHPQVGHDVFFGNGSQVLGPTIIGDHVFLAAGVVIRDSIIGSHVHISMRVRVAGVIIPSHTKVLGEDPEDRSRYWVQTQDKNEPEWIRFANFPPESVE